MIADMTEIHVFTSSAINYIPKVRVLFHSLRKYHPEWRLHLVLADELRTNINLSQEPFDEFHAASELGIPSWRGWSFCHSIVELATAIKPFMLARLLKLPGCKKVIYLDPDTVVFSRLDDIIDALNSSDILLTPHQTRPELTLSAVMDNEISSLKHGIYNLGFIGVSASEVGHEFADWWSKRLYHFCRIDIPNGLFTDQRWIDLVPAFFNGVAIMRSGRHNVATWNLTTRVFSIADNGQYMVDGDPLGFYHFTGFDAGAHRIMAAKHAGNNRAVSGLINWYSKQTASLSKDPLTQIPWAYGFFSDGSPITKAHRIIYRERIDLQNSFPDPFDATGFLKWWEDSGKKKFPSILNKNNRNFDITKHYHALTPGFRSREDEIDWGKVRGFLRQAIFQPKSRLEIGKHGWEVFKNEGVKGITRRFLT